MAKQKGYFETAKKSELIVLRWLLILLGLLLLIMGLYFYVLLPFGIISFFFSHKCKKELKKRKAVNGVTNIPQPETEEPPAEPESPYIFLVFKVAGVTFKNGRKTRQAILRAFKWGDETPETVDFEPYIYEGKNAVYIKINDQIIGNIPSEQVQTFLEYEGKYKRDNIFCDIYGGNKLNDGSRTNYGCKIHIRYLKEEL